MLKERNQIEEKYKWNLDSLYINDDAWETDYISSEQVFKALSEMKGKILDDKIIRR